MLNIIFMGTPDFARDSLEELYNANYNIMGVVTNPDRPKGRGMKTVASPVKEFAIEKGIEVYQPQKVKNNVEFINIIKELNPDIICVVAYGKILPKEILEIPKLGCINLHGSILPKYRGAAPIQWSILNGDNETGVTTIYMNEGMDEGDIILKENVKIGEYETTGELWDRLSKIGAKLLVETLKQIEAGTAPRIPQGRDFTLAPMLNKEMSKIDWNTMPKDKIKNLVRGLNPIMGTYTMYEDRKIKLWKIEISKENYNNELPGTILKASDKEGLTIKTIDGAINVLEIQGENAKRMNVCDFLRGNKLEVGSVLK